MPITTGSNPKTLKPGKPKKPKVPKIGAKGPTAAKAAKAAKLKVPSGKPKIPHLGKGVKKETMLQKLLKGGM